MQFTTLFLTAAIAGSALAGSPDAWGPPAPPAYGHGSGSWPVTSAVSVAPPPPYVTPSPPAPVSVHSLPPYKASSWSYSKKVSSASASGYSSASKPAGPIATATTSTPSSPIASSTGGANSLAQNGVAALAFLGAAAAFAL